MLLSFFMFSLKKNQKKDWKRIEKKKIKARDEFNKFKQLMKVMINKKW